MICQCFCKSHFPDLVIGFLISAQTSSHVTFLFSFQHNVGGHPFLVTLSGKDFRMFLSRLYSLNAVSFPIFLWDRDLEWIRFKTLVLLFDMHYVHSRYSTSTHDTNLSRQYKKQVKFSMRNFAPVRFLHLAWWVMLFVWMPYDEGKGWVTEWKEREKTTDR